MKFIEIYNLLNDAIEIQSENRYDSLYRVDLVKYEKLIEKLKNEVLKEESKETGNYKVSSSIRKILNNKKLKSRPILQKAIKRNGFIEFTDAYTLYRLHKTISGIPYHDEETTQHYPVTDKLIPDFRDKITLNVKKVKESLALLKNDQYLKIDLEYETAIHLEKKYIIALINIFNYKNNEDIILLYDKNRCLGGCYLKPALFKKNNDLAIIMPIREE